MATDLLNPLGIRDPISSSALAGGPSTPAAGRRRFQAAAQRDERLISGCVPAQRGQTPSRLSDLVQRLIEEMDGKF